MGWAPPPSTRAWPWAAWGTRHAALQRESPRDGEGAGASLLPIVTTAPPPTPPSPPRPTEPAGQRQGDGRGGRARWGQVGVRASLLPRPHPPALRTGCHPGTAGKCGCSANRRKTRGGGREGAGRGGGRSPGVGSSGSSSSAAIAQRRSRLMARSYPPVRGLRLSGSARRGRDAGGGAGCGAAGGGAGRTGGEAGGGGGGEGARLSALRPRPSRRGGGPG